MKPLWLVLMVCVVGVLGSRDTTITKLFDNVIASQFQHNEVFDPPFSLQKLKGLFPSDIKLNLVGDPFVAYAREEFGILDNNVFVTLWIAEILMEVHEISDIVTIKPEMLENAVKAIIGFKDKNFPDSSYVYNFWPQVLRNNTWVSYSGNINGIAGDMLNFSKALETFFDDIDLGWLFKYLVGQQIKIAQTELDAFHIPADADDTSLALVLRSIMYKNREQFPGIWKMYTETSFNPTQLMEYYTSYSYSPHNSELDHNAVDPRTYFVIRKFLEENPKTEYSFVTTWLSDINITRRMYNQGVAMPFNVNNIDASVASNALYGLTSLILDSDESDTASSWFSPKVQELYRSTGTYIAWLINTKLVVERPDIALLYYPSIYDFFWFASRPVRMMTTYTSSGRELPFGVMKDVYEMLKKSLRTAGTDSLLAQRKRNVAKGYSYWDDFLGDGDTTWFGTPEVRGGDRLFSTAVVANTWYDLWSVVENGTRKWDEDTSEEVREATEEALHFLEEQLFSGEYELSCAFFSGSVKGDSSAPFAYPSTVLQYLNGTNLPLNAPMGDISPELILAVSGMVPENTYESMITSGLGHFNLPTPLKFKTFNVPDDAFAFWSSKVITQAVSLLAFARDGQFA